MDLTRLSPRSAASKGAVLHLKDPATKKPLYDAGEKVTITVLGAESQAVKDKRQEIERRRLEGEELDEAKAGAEILAAMTVSWSGIGLGSTEPLECTKDNAEELYLHPDAEWIVEQVGPFSRDRRNYTKNRAKS